jgi:hypothetical protein
MAAAAAKGEIFGPTYWATAMMVLEDSRELRVDRQEVTYEHPGTRRARRPLP